MRRYERARKAGELPAADRVIGGSTFRALVEAGHIHPYPLSRPAIVGARYAMRDRHFAALALVVAAELGCKVGGLVVRHADMAALLGCCERTAGSVMRQLVGWGLLSSTPFYERCGAGHARLASLYRVTAGAAEIFALRRIKRPGKNCQASDTVLRTDQEEVVSAGQNPADGSPGGSYERVRAQPPTRPQTPRSRELGRQLAEQTERIKAELHERSRHEFAALVARERGRVQLAALAERPHAPSATPASSGCTCETRTFGNGHTVLVSPGPCWPACDDNPSRKKQPS